MAQPIDSRNPERTQAALDELGLTLLDAESTHSVLQKVVDLVCSVMPEGVDASITLVRDGQATTAAYTGQLARDLDELQYEMGYGPCMEAAVGGYPIRITDGRIEDRWPSYMPTFLERGALSSLAVPVPAAHPTAALNVYAIDTDAFTDADVRTAAHFASYAAVALANMDALENARDLAENLQAAMRFRSVIEQAKGILMERHKLTADQAFRLLAETSMHTNRKVRDVAENLVLTGEVAS